MENFLRSSNISPSPTASKHNWFEETIMDQQSSHRGRVYALPFRITLPPSKAVTVDIRQELGRGVCGIVLEALIDGKQCALKLYNDESAFIREHRAYASISNTSPLSTQTARFIGTFDRIPELFPGQTQVYSRGICLEYIRGSSLNDVIYTLSDAQRKAVRLQLQQTLDLLHEGAGVVHGDLRGPNIILAEGGARLIDLSHAGFRYDMTPGLWGKRMAEDYELLDEIFKEAEERVAEQTSIKILNMLTPGIPASRIKQTELAALLQSSPPSSIPLELIIEHIPNPTPVLALSITRAYKHSCGKQAAIKFAESYLSRFKDVGYKSSDARQFLVLKITYARYQGMLSFDSGITLFQETIAEFTQYLGETHICTLQARFECAQLWFRERGSVKTALIQCLEILRTLYRFGNGNGNGDGIVHFKGQWKKKPLELVQTCKMQLEHEDSLRRRVDDALEQMNLL